MYQFKGFIKFFGFTAIIVIVLLLATSVVKDKSAREEMRYYNAINGSVPEESSSDEQITVTVTVDKTEESEEPHSKEVADEVLNEYIQNWKDQANTLEGPFHMEFDRIELNTKYNTPSIRFYASGQYLNKLKELQKYYVSRIDSLSKTSGSDSEWRSALINETYYGGNTTSKVYDYALEFIDFVNVSISELDKVAAAYGDPGHFDYELFVSEEEYSGEFISVNFHDGYRHLIISGVSI